jgi:hypothetical protein
MSTDSDYESDPESESDPSENNPTVRKAKNVCNAVFSAIRDGVRMSSYKGGCFRNVITTTMSFLQVLKTIVDSGRLKKSEKRIFLEYGGYWIRCNNLLDENPDTEVALLDMKDLETIFENDVKKRGKTIKQHLWSQWTRNVQKLADGDGKMPKVDMTKAARVDNRGEGSSKSPASPQYGLRSKSHPKSIVVPTTTQSNQGASSGIASTISSQDPPDRQPSKVSDESANKTKSAIERPSNTSPTSSSKPTKSSTTSFDETASEEKRLSEWFNTRFEECKCKVRDATPNPVSDDGDEYGVFGVYGVYSSNPRRSTRNASSRKVPELSYGCKYTHSFISNMKYCQLTALQSNKNHGGRDNA